MTRRARFRWALLIAAATLALGGWRLWRKRAGDPSEELGEAWNKSQRVLDRDGELLEDLASSAGVHGEPLPLAAIGDRLVSATLVSEDRRFYQHDGIDLGAALRAVGQNLRHRRIVSGASTITEQLVKMLDAGGAQVAGRTLVVKAREAARAQNLEEHHDKSEILEAYLNRLPYGHGLVGPAAAAEAYFGVHPRDLSWAQAALIAVLPRAPSYLDPYRHLERAMSRQRALLAALHHDGLLGDADYQRAGAEPIAPRPIARAHAAPYLVDALRQGHYGGLEPSGATRTTIDRDLERDVEGLIDTHLERLSDRRATSAAVIVVDNASGEVLAYAGGHGALDEEHGQIDMARTRRQPGSALKPFAYAIGFERGLSPTAMLADVPTRFADRAGAWAPVNFDGTFWGPVSAREALAGSLNIPAVRVTAGFGEAVLLERLHQLGFASLDQPAQHYGLALVLGAGEVTLAELATGYATLARAGEGLRLRYRTGDEGEHGARILDAAAVAAVADALSDPQARIRGLGSVGPFDLGFPVAVKTGTSSGYRDGWTAGFSHERTVAVWVGNPDGRATAELTGALGAGPLFAAVMQRAMRDVTRREPLWDEALLHEALVCPLSGKRAGDGCPHGVRRRLPRAAAESSERCDLHRHASQKHGSWRCDPRGGKAIVTLPEPFTAWLAAQPSGAPGRDVDGLPWLAVSAIPGCSQERDTELRIEDPAPGSVLVAGDGGVASVELSASWPGADETAAIELVLDGRVAAELHAPFRAHLAVSRGDHRIAARPADARLAVRIATTDFSVR